MRKRALVLERDHVTTDLLRSCLDRLDFEVDCADSSDAALRWAAAVEPDLCIINLTPIGLCGIEVAAQLRTRGLRRTPMIALSDSLPMLRVAGLYDLFEAYLLNPLQLDYVLSELVRVIARSRTVEAHA